MELLQGLLSNDLARLADGEAQYTLLTNESGGIVDDLIAYRISPFHTLLVVNAGNREAACDWIKEREIRGSEVRDASDDYGAPGRARPVRDRVARTARRARLHARDGPRCRHRGDDLPHGVHGRVGCRADVRRRGHGRAVGRDRRERDDALRPRRPRHAPARGLLSVARQRHQRRYRRDLGRPRLDVCARQGVQRSGRAAPDQGGRTPEAVGRVRDGREGRAATGHADRGRRRGHLGNALADARRRHRAGIPSRGRRGAGDAARSRRPRQAEAGARRPESRSTSRRRSRWQVQRPTRKT